MKPRVTQLPSATPVVLATDQLARATRGSGNDHEAGSENIKS
jgi:hypothetical protein